VALGGDGIVESDILWRKKYPGRQWAAGIHKFSEAPRRDLPGVQSANPGHGTGFCRRV